MSDFWPLFFSFFSPSRLFSDLCVFWQAIRVKWSRQAPAFLRGEACPPTPHPPEPRADHRVLDQEAAFPGFHEMQRNCGDFRELAENRNKKCTSGREKRYLGQKITSLLWLYTARSKHNCLNNLYADNNPGVRWWCRGKGVGLQPLWAREEEWVPGDVILTGRGAAVTIQQALREKIP